jgi:hypothetical protein
LDFRFTEFWEVQRSVTRAAYRGSKQVEELLETMPDDKTSRLPPGYRLDLVGDPCIILRGPDGEDVTRKKRLYLLGKSAIGITTIVFTGLIFLRWASSQRKGQRSAKSSKTTREESMFGWGKKDKPNKKRNVPDVEIHVPELDIDRLEITLENLAAHVDVDATIGRPGNEFLNISIGVNARIDSAQIVLEDVQAEAHVIAYLDDVRVIALRALEVLDHHPEILTGLVDVPIPDPEPVGAKGL